MWHFGYFESIIVFILISPLIVKLIKKNKGKPYNLIFNIAFAIYIVKLISIVFFPLMWIVPPKFPKPSMQLVPFRTIMLMWNFGGRTFIKQVLGNIALFMPLGFLLPFLFKKASSFKNMLLISIFTSISIELIQFGFDLIVKWDAKSCDIDDVILNVLGGIVGFLIYKIIDKFFINYTEKLNLSN